LADKYGAISVIYKNLHKFREGKKLDRNCSHENFQNFKRTYEQVTNTMSTSIKKLKQPSQDLLREITLAFQYGFNLNSFDLTGNIRFFEHNGKKIKIKFTGDFLIKESITYYIQKKLKLGQLEIADTFYAPV
jgi:hypothetical protein